MAQPREQPFGATISPHNLQSPSDCSNSWQGTKLANDQSVWGGIFAHTSLPISTPCSLPAAENLGLYIIFPQQQPPSLISVWKLWRSTGNGKKTSSFDSATHSKSSNSQQAVSDTPLSFWWPCTIPSFGLRKGNCDIQLMKLMASSLRIVLSISNGVQAVWSLYCSWDIGNVSIHVYSQLTNNVL